MKRNSYVVFGLGAFGYSLAETLGDSGYEVMVVDKRNDPIQTISDKVTYAVKADVTEPGVLESLDICQFDVAVVAFTQDMNASIMAAMYAKESGIPKVAGHSLRSLDVRGKYNLNVIAIKDGEEVVMNLDPDQVLSEQQMLVVMGDNASLDQLLERG